MKKYKVVMIDKFNTQVEANSQDEAIDIAVDIFAKTFERDTTIEVEEVKK
jgi:hypothetical protein